MRQFQSKKFTKKNHKYSKNMRGGASSASSASDNNALLFSEIVKPLTNSGYYAHSGILSDDVFESDPLQRKKLKIKQKFHNIIINEYNTYGQTALYVVLRFNPTEEMIRMLLEVPGIDVNRRNTGEDDSTPLMGACYGNNASTIINWNLITYIIKLLCTMEDPKKCANITLQNEKYGETALKILENKISNKKVNFN